MKKYLWIFIVLICFMLSLQTGTAQIQKTTPPPKPKIQYDTKGLFVIGAGGGLNGLAFNAGVYYYYFGLGITLAGFEAAPEEYFCDYCTFPHDGSYTKKYNQGWASVDLLGKIPILPNRLYLTGAVGYAWHSWLEQEIYYDAIYPNEYHNIGKGTDKTGISYGGGLIVRITNTGPMNLCVGLEYRNPTGVFVNIGITF